MPTRISCTVADMRKRPQQARSRATINAIIDASAHILRSRGLDRFNTNLVAEKAGVSIGTLYQYFPNKRVLLEALRERHLNDILGTLHAASRPTLARADRLAVFAEGMIGAHLSLPAAFGDLQHVLPEKHTDNAAFETLYRSAYCAFTAVNTLGRASFDPLDRVLASSVTGAVHDAVAEGFVADPLFKAELLKIVTALLG